MKKIVNGLLYDTNNAKEIYRDEKRNKAWYQTEKGNYFTAYGTGEIIPVTEDAVKKFLGEKDIKAYIKLFGDVEEA